MQTKKVSIFMQQLINWFVDAFNLIGNGMKKNNNLQKLILFYLFCLTFFAKQNQKINKKINKLHCSS